MYIFSIDKGISYVYDTIFPEEILGEMFRKHFGETFQQEAVDWRIAEMWEKISLNIPKCASFIEKDSVLYVLSKDLKIEIAPEDFFEIDEFSHPILLECFQKCYNRFKELMKSYKEWNQVSIKPLGNIYLNFPNATRCISRLGSITQTLEEAGEAFTKRLVKTFKSPLCDEVGASILKSYEGLLFSEKPVMFVTTTNLVSNVRKVYGITEDLHIVEIPNSLIERELEDILHKLIPQDTDFLGNAIYNYIMLPLISVPPYIRVNSVQDSGINATICFEERNIPIICDQSFTYGYALTSMSGVNQNDFPISTQIRFNSKIKLQVEPIHPLDGIRAFQKVDSNIFKDTGCYFQFPGEKYTIKDTHYEYTINKNLLYYLDARGHLGRLGDKVYSNYSYVTKAREELNNIAGKAIKAGCYAFWRIKLQE